METFSLKVGLVVTLHGAKLRLRKSLGNGVLLWTNELDEPSKIKESDFYSFYDSRELFIDEEQPHLGMIPTVRNAPPDITCFPETHAGMAFRRRSYLVRLVNSVGLMLPPNRCLRKLIQEVAKDTGDTLPPPSVSTVRRWFNLFRTGSIVKLVPHHTDKGRSRIIQGELEELVSDLIETDYLTLERPLVSPVYEKLKSQIEKVNEGRLPSLRLVVPSEMTFRRYVDSMDPYALDTGRLGKHAANQIHRTAIGKLTVEKILDRWEIDHTPLDILVVDANTGKHIGRPFLTIVLDRHSRMIMAYLIHFAAPNTESVLRAIERAIRPKAAWLARFPSVLSEWRAHGLPSRIVPDNAAEFHADDLINAFNELGIEIMYPASRAPQKKGAVERFFRTLNDGLIHRLPGTTFSDTKERGDYPSEALACLTLEDLEAKLVKWIVDVYHQRTHRGLPALMSPAQAWLAGERHRHICLPTDLDALESVLARRKHSPVHHYGVEVGTHVYHSAELAELKMKLDDGEKVQVRYRDELGHVWIHDRFRNVFILVSAKDKRLIGLSRETFDLAREKLRHAGKRSPSFEAVHQAYQDIMNDVADLKRSQKTRERREAAKVKLDRGGLQPPSVQLNSEKAADFIDGDIETDAISRLFSRFARTSNEEIIMNAIIDTQSPFSLRQHFICSPQSDHAIARMEEVRQDTLRTQTSKGLVIQGPSGVGKSSLIREYMRSEADEPPESKNSVLVVEMPSSPSKKNLATAVLTAMKDPFATARGHSAEHKFSRIITLLRNQRITMVILDEAQHLVDYKKVGAYEAADWIKSLMNEADITVVLVGLKRTEGLLWANEQLRRRFSASIDYGRYDLTEETWKQFAGLLKAVQSLLPVESISFLSKDMLQRFHLASFGLIDYLIKILDRSVWLVQHTGAEGIDLGVLSQAFKDEVWSRVPGERNPFTTTFDFRPLTGGREPFENFDQPSA